jgi:hypothetical protein
VPSCEYSVIAHEQCSSVIATFGRSEKIIQMAAAACTNHFNLAGVKQMLLICVCTCSTFTGTLTLCTDCARRGYFYMHYLVLCAVE